jgi:23S rRNA (guanine745-N1)-methyltransferase
MAPTTAEYLRCPVCGGMFAVDAVAMRCARGHHFDIARHGYVNLLTGRTPSGADTQAMVIARAELLAAGHFDFLSAALAQAAHEALAQAARDAFAQAAQQAVVDDPEPWGGGNRATAARGHAGAQTGAPGLIVDVGAGPGHHLAAVLDRLPHHHGLALDVAKPAVRRAVRAHSRADAAVCDAWRGLPLADACADIVLNVFAPRNGAEFRRVLKPWGALIVVTPRPGHLAEVAAALGLVSIDPHKERRLETALGRLFSLESQAAHESRLILGRSDAARLVAMGPSAWHNDPARATARLARLPEPLSATAAVDLRVYRPR